MRALAAVVLMALVLVAPAQADPRNDPVRPNEPAASDAPAGPETPAVEGDAGTIVWPFAVAGAVFAVGVGTFVAAGRTHRNVVNASRER